MKIGSSELTIRPNVLNRTGHHEGAVVIKRESLKQVRESGCRCPCGGSVPPRQLLCVHDAPLGPPVHMHVDMGNERLHKLSLLTEGPLRTYGDQQLRAQKTPVPDGTGVF